MLTHLVIRRSEWLRGEPLKSCLLRGDGKRCCVGIYLAALGVPDRVLRPRGGRATARSVFLEDPDWFPESASWLVHDWLDSQVAHELYAVNDSTTIDKHEIEANIAALFASQGITVEFTDE